MNRDAMVIYLRDVRDLEVARHCLQQRLDALDREEAEVAAKCDELRHEDRQELVELPKKPSALLRFIGILVMLLGVGLAIVTFLTVAGIADSYPTVHTSMISKWADQISYTFQGVLVGIVGWAISIVVFLVGLVMVIGYTKSDYLEQLEEAEEHNRQAEEFNANLDATRTERHAQADQLERRMTSQRAQLKAELDQVDGLLDQYYALNVLPSQYRSLIPVCYIYEYMSTSQATLEDTLMHEHLENGFERLEEKLDEVIDAVEEQVYETRCLRAENREQAQRLATQNQLQLKLLERTEQNTADAARYAQLAECNTAACAYFELAAYLKD